MFMEKVELKTSVIGVWDVVDNHYNKYSQLESQTVGMPGEALVGQPAGCRLAGPEKGRLCCS
jgi:hypothetical protein